MMKHNLKNRKEKIKKAKELLVPIQRKLGAYNLEPLKHATNVINESSKGAEKAIKILDDILAELEDFEKELRDRLKKLEEIPKENQIWKVSYPLQMTIKEILGET